MTYSAPPLRVRWGFCALSAVALLMASVALSFALATAGRTRADPPTPPGRSHVRRRLEPRAREAGRHHSRARRSRRSCSSSPESSPAPPRRLVRTAGGRVTGELHVINGLAARMSAGEAHRSGRKTDVRAVSLNAGSSRSRSTPSQLATSYNQSLDVREGLGQLGDRQRHRRRGDRHRHRRGPAGLPAAAVEQPLRGWSTAALTNPNATTATTGTATARTSPGSSPGTATTAAGNDPLRGKYVGVAPTPT